MNTLFSRGFVPMDISHNDEGMYGLLVSAGLQVDGWQIVRLPYNVSTIEEVQVALRERGLTPWGISVHGNEALVLGLDESGDVEPREVALLSHGTRIDVYTEAINHAVQQQELYPWGFSIIDNQLLVQYIQND